MNLIQIKNKSFKTLEEPDPLNNNCYNLYNINKILPSLFMLQNSKKIVQTPKQPSKSNTIVLSNDRSKKKFTNDPTSINIRSTNKIKSARRIENYEQKQNIIPPKLQLIGKPPSSKQLDEQNQKQNNNFKIKQYSKGYQRGSRIQNILNQIQVPSCSIIKIPNQIKKPQFSQFLFSISNTAFIKAYNQPQKIKSKIFLLNISIFIQQISFWQSQQQLKLKPQTKNIINTLAQHSNIAIIYNNQTQLNTWYHKISDLKSQILAHIFIKKQKNSKIYDLTNVLQYLNIPNDTNIYIVQPVVDDIDLNSIYQQRNFPISKTGDYLSLLFMNLSKKSEISKLYDLLNSEKKQLEINNMNIRVIKSNELVKLKELALQYEDRIHLNEITMLKIKNNSESRIRSINNLENFKQKLNKYIKILQNQSQSTQQKYGFSFTYLVGDLIKRNYPIQKQITNSKYYLKIKHQKILTEIPNIIQPCQQSKYTYKLPIFLITA